MKRSLMTCMAVSTLLFSLSALGASSAPPTTNPAPGTFEAYQAEGTAAQKQFKLLVPNNEFLADSNPKRAEVAPAGITLLKGILLDLDGMVKTKPDYKWPVYPVRSLAESELYALGDAETVSKLDGAAKMPGREGIRAKRTVLRAQWFMAGEDKTKLASVFSQLDELAKSQPGDASLSMMISEMGVGLTDEDDKQHMLDLLENVMENQTADAGIRNIKNHDKMHSFQGKPLVLSGTTPEGQPFTTADWKGKVVLVDFWAAWCVPCKAELPRVQEVYNQYHDKGFEVLGVDNDQSAKAVISYSTSAKLPWPQLFDEAAATKGAWHPYTKMFGIDGIPVMFLIDKKGICRTVTAREDFEKLIPKMLAE